jgi:hypothetical protein
MTPHSSSILTSSFTALALLSTALGCNQDPVHDLGNTSQNLATQSDATDAELPPVAQFARDFTGVWIGDAEDPLALAPNADRSPPLFHFPSGSARIRLALAVTEGEHFPSGTLTFGDAPPPPLATDPAVGYPIEPDVSLPPLASAGGIRPPVEGFVYQVFEVGVGSDVARLGRGDFFEEGLAIDGKLDLEFTPTEVFTSWCALQTAATCDPSKQIADEPDGSCTFGVEQAPIDCLKASQCAISVCTCSADQPCSFSSEQSARLTIRFSSDGVVGLFNGIFLNERGFEQPLGTVHLHRETPGEAARP